MYLCSCRTTNVIHVKLLDVEDTDSGLSGHGANIPYWERGCRRSSIRYALTVNPTIYTLCIKQFWATAKEVRTVVHSGLDIDEAINEEHVSTPSYDPSQSEIATLKERVKKLEKKRRSRTYKPRRLYKVGLSGRIKSSNDASLGAQEDASKQGRKIADLDADIEVTLIDETQGRNEEDLMFDSGVHNGDEVFQEPMVNTATTTSLIPVSAVDPVTTAGEVVTTASVEIPEELTLAQTLIEIKSAKPKAFTTAVTIVTPASSRPKAKGIVFHDQEEQAPVSTPIVSPS
ncbi:hypothetical protein Tco_0180917 [Tanacetum coccineum]